MFRVFQATLVHHYSYLLFLVIPPVMDLHVMLKKIECEMRVWLKKSSQRKLESHLPFDKVMK